MVYQEKTPQQIGVVILIICLVDNVLASLGEVACLSLLGVKLRKDISLLFLVTFKTTFI